MAGISPVLPVFRPTANLAEASKRPAFRKSVSEASIVKINNMPELQKELTQIFSNYNDSCSESCQDSFFSEVYLLLLVRLLSVGILGAIVTSHTHRNVANQQIYGQIIINCGVTILIVSLFSLCRLRITTQLRSGAVDKMAGIVTKRIWQPYICQPNELKREIKKKTGRPSKNLGRPWPTQVLLESPLDVTCLVGQKGMHGLLQEPTEQHLSLSIFSFKNFYGGMCLYLAQLSVKLVICRLSFVCYHCLEYVR